MAESQHQVNNDECAICLGPLEDACQADCQHRFCKQCILQYLEMRPPAWSGTCPLCRSHISVYSLLDSSGLPLGQPEVTTLYGGEFVQFQMPGLASYHFDAEDDCYISYASAPPSWRLDDGSSLPRRKPWNNTSFDAASRTFRGTIEWSPVGFNGDRRWDYTIVFADNFAGVTGGEIVCTGVNDEVKTIPFKSPWGEEEDGLSYLRWVPPPSTVYGTTFVQGRQYSPHAEGIASYHFNSPDDCYISYSNAPASWRMDNGESPPTRKKFQDASFDAESRTFQGTISWSPNTMGGAATWQYRMVFAEDFRGIVRGHMEPYGPDGELQPIRSFGNPLDLSPLPQFGHLYYVRKPAALTMR